MAAIVMVEHLVQRLQELGLSTETIALAQGMLLGDKSVLDPELVRQFRIAGMSHLMAVSGLHVGIIMSIVWLLFRPLEVLVNLITPPHITVYYAMGLVKHIVVIAVTILYVYLIGAPPSAVRAALMLSLCLVGHLLHRPTSPWHCLVLTALILLVLNPWNITQIGFQLSFLSVAGILLFRPWLQHPALPRWFRLILLSVSAQWLSAPFVAFYFHQLPILGFLQGLLVVPVVPFFVAGLLLGTLFPTWHWLCQPLELFHSWSFSVAQFIGHCERLLLLGHLYFYPTWLEVLLSEIALLALFFLLRFRIKLSDPPQS